MSSYRGASGAWDGGPPGAESDYVGQPPPYGPAPPRPLPTTDPWTGVSYSQYGQPSYDYQAYTAPPANVAPAYSYNYDYYQNDGSFYGKYPDANAYSQQQPGFEYQARPRERTHSPVESRTYERRRSYRSHSRSASPYEQREQGYSRKRESSYEEGRQASSSSRSKKHKKYSPSSSSRSRSYTPKNKKRSASSDSSSSKRSYRRKSNSRASNRSLTPPLRKNTHQSKTRKTPSTDRSTSKSPSRDNYKTDAKAYARKEKRGNDKRPKVDTTPSRRKETPTKALKKTDRSSLTPPRSYKKSERSGTPPRKYKYKDRREGTPPRKARDSSVTPPKSYARSSSTSCSKSRSRSSTPRQKRKRSRSQSSRFGRSQSSASSAPSETNKKRKRKSASKNRSRSKSSSPSKHRSRAKRSKSRGRSKRSASRGSKSHSRSRSSRSRSRSGSGTPSDDERRGQFTVADRKRFWKLHRSKQEVKDKESRTPPKETKPPPGAVESTHVDDIEYGVPPEVEGPNFAELLSPPDQSQLPSSSKTKPIPIPIKNDGSFLEMFKKMQEATKKAEPTEKKPEIKKPALPFIGKRRGGRVLKTGLVKKAKAIDEQTVDNAPKDAWSLYMQEVKKYRETSCEEERKTRPLVK